MPVRAIIFDVDGTLGETEPIHREAFNEAFRVLDLAWHFDTETYAELMSIPGGRARLRHFIHTRYAADEERFEQEGLFAKVHRKKTQIFGRLLEDSGASLRPGVSRLITDARSSGVRLAACTSSQLQTFEILIVNALGIEAISWFKAVVAGDDVQRKKPHPEGYLKVLEQLRVRPDQAVVIEDSGRGVAAARAAGIPVIAVPNHLTQHEDLSGARIVLSDLGEPNSPFEVIRGDPQGFSYASIRAIEAWVGNAPLDDGFGD